MTETFDQFLTRTDGSESSFLWDNVPGNSEEIFRDAEGYQYHFFIAEWVTESGEIIHENFYLIVDRDDEHGDFIDIQRTEKSNFQAMKKKVLADEKWERDEAKRAAKEAKAAAKAAKA